MVPLHNPLRDRRSMFPALMRTHSGSPPLLHGRTTVLHAGFAMLSDTVTEALT